MNWELGTAFKETSGGHLYFIVAKVDVKRVVVSLASFTSNVRADDSCIIEIGEHPFIRNRTYVNYKRSEIWSIEQLEKMLEDRKIKRHNEPADRDLIVKILRNASRSQFVKYRIKAAMEAQLLDLGGE